MYTQTQRVIYALKAWESVPLEIHRDRERNWSLSEWRPHFYEETNRVSQYLNPQGCECRHVCYRVVRLEQSSIQHLANWASLLCEWSNQSLQSCLTLFDPMDCNPPGSSVHGILQARILEWVAMLSSRGIPTQGLTLCLLTSTCIGRGVLGH